MSRLLYKSDEDKEVLRALMRKVLGENITDEKADAANRGIQIYLLWLWLHFSRTLKEVPNCLQLDFSAQLKLENIIEELREDQDRYFRALEV